MPRAEFVVLAAVIACSVACASGGAREPMVVSGAPAVTAPPTAADLHAGHFAGSRLALVATHATGELFVSSDGGVSWERGADLPDQYLETVWLFDDAAGFVAGERGLYRTMDGGRTLTQVEEAAGLNMYGVEFPTAKRGFAVGFATGPGPVPAVLRSDDGGSSWRRLDGPPRDGMAAALHFVSSELGVIAAGRDLWQTRDGGESWTVVARQLGTVRAIHRAPGGRWWAVGHRGLVAISADGATWTTWPHHPPQLLRDVLFVDERNGWLAGDAALPAGAGAPASAPPLWRTRDGGQTWSPVAQVRFDVHRLLRRGAAAPIAIGDGGRMIELRP
jgi:photosystem II stability/assembly factor-like uncharacterized protein